MKKRIPAVLLVVCLLFAVLAAPASAVEGEWSCVSDAEDYWERIPTSVVQARLAGGTDYLDKFGVTREKIIRELSAHEYDNYYLNTPFVGGDWQSPRGDTSYNGAPGTNCAGFVAYVLRKCGLDVQAAISTMKKGRFTCWGSGRKYDGLSSASNYMSLAEKGKIVAYAYPSKAALLAGGKCEKGDIVLRFWTDQWGGYDEDNHLMIFWGNTPSEDKVWQNASGRLHIGPLWSGDASSYIVIKFAPMETPATGFYDVKEESWYADAVTYVREKGLMTGTDKWNFSPDSQVTRGQIVTTLWRFSGEPDTFESAGFKDVSEGQYYSTAVKWATSLGIVQGYEDGRFRPEGKITRQEMAALLYRFCRYQGLKMSDVADLEEYEDADDILEYAQIAMGWACQAGLITGTTPTTLRPLARTSRAQTAEILMRLNKLFEER